MDLQNQDFQSWDLLGVFLIGVLGLIITLLSGKKQPLANIKVTPGPSPAQQEADKKESEEEKKAEQQAAQNVADAEKAHDQSVQQQISDLEKKTAADEGNPKATNDDLLDIGKQVRGG